MSLGARVKELRLKKGMNQACLAHASGISQATISRIEQGKIQELKSSAMGRLAAALEVPIASLIERPQRSVILKDSGEEQYRKSCSGERSRLIEEAVKTLVSKSSFQQKLSALLIEEIESSLPEED